MKKIYLTFAVALTALAGVAQNRNAMSLQTISKNQPAVMSVTPEVMINGCDTVTNLLLTDSAVVYLAGASPVWGYTSGHNSYNDVSKAEKIHASTYTAGYQVIAMYMFLAQADDGTVPTIMQATVWGDNAGVPGTSLGTSPLPIAAMQTGGNATIVSFATPVSVTGDFYVGLDGFAYQTPQQDTVSIYSTTQYTQQATCNAFDQWSAGGGWYSWDDANNWGIKAGYWMGVILCDPTLGTIEITNPGTEVVVYPNPSNGDVYANFGAATSGNVNVKVYDAMGKMVSESNQNVQANGTYKVEMNGAAAGVYYMNISSANKTETKKIVIQ